MNALITVADYAALPGVVGVEDGVGKVTLYTEHEVSDYMREFVAERSAATLLVVWKVDRRRAERRRRPTPAWFPPIPEGVRWA